MTELMDEQNAKERNREGPAGLEHLRVLGKPAPWPEVAVPNYRGHAFDKIVHEPRAVGGCGDYADGQQKEREPILPKGGEHWSFGCLLLGVCGRC